MKHFLILIALILYAGKVCPQSDFRQGYIINHNNDTIFGYIDYRGIIENSKKCIFKPDLLSEEQVFFPMDISAYKFLNSKFYISKLLKKGDTEEMFFLEYLINGVVDIFFLRDVKGDRYFVEKDEECIIYEKSLPEILIDIGPVIGMNLIQINEKINSENPDFYYLTGSRFKKKIYPSFGLYLVSSLPNINERLSFQYIGTYSNLELKTYNSYKDPGSSLYYLNEIVINQDIFGNLFFIKYVFPNIKFSPTFQIGGFANYLFNTSFKRNLEINFSSGRLYFTEEFMENPLNKVEYGIGLGLGFSRVILQKNEILFNINYQRGFGLFHGINTDNCMLCIGYKLW